LPASVLFSKLFPLTIPEILTIKWEDNVRPSFFQKYLKSGKMDDLPPSFIMDPGIQREIIQKTGIMSGNEYESAVVAEIYKQARNLNYPVSFYHLRTVDGRESDLLLETNKGYIAIEIKMSDRIARSDSRHIRGLETILDKPVLQSFLLSNDNSIMKPDDKIIALPAATFLTKNSAFSILFLY
jgi:predicted AAA+ superfamily ATPase